MANSLKLDIKVNRAAFKVIPDKKGSIARAAVAALREVAADAVQEGRQNIAGSGRFKGRWISGLQYRMQEGSEPLQSKAIIFHSFGIAGVFEHGATIQGKPLLWIPTEPGGPRASRSGKKLTSATVRGQPMLFDANDRNRDRKPLYIGVPSVRIQKRWRITEIVKQHAKRLGALFFKHFRDT